MKISGIIAEYNPFHNGHAFHIEETKKRGADAIVVVLGGNFTQRGDVSILSKLSKARCAIEGGADLVIELPCVYSLGAAKDFALGGVKLLDSMGCIDTLSFGSEEKDLQNLINTANIITDLEKNSLLKPEIIDGAGFAGAREAMLKNACYDQEADIIKKPNNILAIEYLLALKNINSPIQPVSITRSGALHDEILSFDSNLSKGHICSASHLRNIIKNDFEKSAFFMPEKTFEILNEEKEKGRFPIYLNNLEQAIISRMRMISASDIKNINGVSEGLENRIIYAVRNSVSLDDMFSVASSKRYTMSRIRRIVLGACIGVSQKLSHYDPQYIRVLASNKKGFDILKKAKTTSKLPIVTRTARISSISNIAAEMSEVECAAFDLYSLAFSPIGKCGLELTETNF